MSVVVGGVSQLYQGDHDVGRLAAEALAAQDLGGGVEVHDLHYGAVAVAQLLADARPATLVLVGAAERGRPPGTVERRLVPPPQLDDLTLGAAVQDAATGHVSIDLVVEVAAALGALPPRTVSVELEPVSVAPSTTLSPEAERALPELVALAAAEAVRAPLLDLAAQLRALLADGHLEPGRATAALAALIGELEVLERESRWGGTFAARDRLRSVMAEGEAAEGMTHLDWGLWWTLIEGLDRVQAQEAASPSAG